MNRVEMENQQDQLMEKFSSSRNLSVKICEGLAAEDLVVQSMKDVSPAKWHLAHTTWFYDAMILKPFENNYQAFQEKYHFLFNSYYKCEGQHWQQYERGVLSRPTADEILLYRDNTSIRIMSLLSSDITEELKVEVMRLVEIGINHEQQHQELMLMDLKHVLGTNPLYPVWHEGEYPKSQVITEEFIVVEGGVREIGKNFGEEYIFDNESPRHKEYVEDFFLSNKLVTNGEYLEFINSDSYHNPDLWLSDGWDLPLSKPLYWQEDVKEKGKYWESTPYGLKELDLDAPVCHMSYFEADAYASWRGCRLPTEREWEVAAQSVSSNSSSGNPSKVQGQFFDQNELMPKAGHLNGDFNDLFGVLWQWTSSHYEMYPGYHKPKGALGEYNAKFANAQRVLRGGSFGTLQEHFRISYRNFFAADKRWPFTGIRLAKNKN